MLNIEILSFIKDNLTTIPDIFKCIYYYNKQQTQNRIYANNMNLYYNYTAVFIKNNHFVYIGGYNIIPDLLSQFWLWLRFDNFGVLHKIPLCKEKYLIFWQLYIGDYLNTAEIKTVDYKYYLNYLTYLNTTNTNNTSVINHHILIEQLKTINSKQYSDEYFYNSFFDDYKLPPKYFFKSPCIPFLFISINLFLTIYIYTLD